MMLSVPFGAAVLAVERSGSGRALICLHAGVAVDFALAHPGKVRGLILIASAVSGAPVEPLPSDIQPLEGALDAAEKAGDLAKVNAIEAHMWLDGPRSAAGRVSGAKRDLFLTMNRIALEQLAGAYQELRTMAEPELLELPQRPPRHADQRVRHIDRQPFLLALGQPLVEDVGQGRREGRIEQIGGRGLDDAIAVCEPVEALAQRRLRPGLLAHEHGKEPLTDRGALFTTLEDLQ